MLNKNKILVFSIFIFILLPVIGFVPSALADGPSPDFEAIRQAAVDYFPLEPRQYRLSVDDLYTLLHDGDPANDPLVVSVQTRAEYELGHIPGAINIPWDELTDVAQLTSQIPMDKLTVIYCNHDVHSAQISAILNLLGYNTLDLLFGFEGWTKHPLAVSDRFDPNCVCECGGYTLSTEPTLAEPFGIYPNLDVPGGTSAEVIATAASTYLASQQDTDSTICACDLNDILSDDDPTGDPFVLSLQWPDGYAAGHVPTAVNIPRWDLFTVDNLSRLPTDRPIVVCCYLGYTSSQVVAILNMMGYDAKVALHGLCGWTADPEITLFDIDDPRNWRDYPFEGTALTMVPEPTPEPASLCAEEYVVQASDWLSQVSDKFLDDPLLFPAIAEATNQMNAIDDSFAKIANPNTIEPGWKLCIPPAE